MLGLKEAAKTYNDNPADPYVILPSDESIEVRFSEDGMITAAYQIGGHKWGSDEFIHGLVEQNRRAVVDELPRKEEVRNRPQAQPQIPRQKKRIRLNALRDL